MKKRKVFLEGYIELVPEFFGGRSINNTSYVSIDSNHKYIGLSVGAMKEAKAKVNRGEIVSARIGVHENKDKFVIVFDEEGKLKTRKYQTGSIRFACASVIRKLAENGFAGGKRYKVTSPEENVLVVTKEEM